MRQGHTSKEINLKGGTTLGQSIINRREGLETH